MNALRWRHRPEVHRITGARPGLAEDVRGRERRYVISMLIRTACVLLAVALWNISLPLAVAALVVGVAMPYVAVVIANAGRENSPAVPSSFVPAAPRNVLAPPPERGEDHRPAAGPRPDSRPQSGS